MDSESQSALFRVLSERLQHYLSEGEWERAESVSRTAIDRALLAVEENELEVSLSHLVEALRGRASLSLARGHLERALERFGEALELVEASPHVRPGQRVLLKSDCARVFEALGRPEEAIPLYQEAISILEAEGVHGDVQLANLHNNLGMILKNQGRLEEAEAQYLTTLEAFEKVYGPASLETASIYNNIGGLYQAAGHFDRALEMHFQALELRLALGGVDGLETGQSLSNLAAGYHAMGDEEQAAKFYQLACEALARHRDTEPEICAIVEENWGILQEEMASKGDESDEVESSSEPEAPVELSYPAPTV